MIFLEFKDRQGNIPKKSGINQMHSVGHVCDYDAYIPIRKAVRDSSHLTIPDNGTIVDVIWDGNQTMEMMFESSKIGTDGVAQQLASTPERSTLGKYLRTEMGLKTGTRISKKQIDFPDFTVANPGVELDCINGQWTAKFIY